VTRAFALVLLVGLTWSGCVPDPGRQARSSTVQNDERRALLDAEDARPQGGDALQLLVDAANSEDAGDRRIAVRALGRLERPDLSEVIERHLSDPDPPVREAAAEALAQSVHGSDGARVLDPLLDRIPEEADAEVRAMLARSIGRLRLDDAGRRRAVEGLVQLGDEGTPPEEVLLGVALGFESLVRRSEGDGVSRPAADLLTNLMRRGVDRAPPPEGDVSGHIRALAVAALGPSRRLSSQLIDAALDDPEPQVRRAVLPYLSALPPTRREAPLRRAFADTSAMVQIAAIRYLAPLARTAPRCEDLMAAAAPERPPSVRIVALETLARGCPNFSAQRSVLAAAASELGTDGPWQPAARALLSLANVDSDRARRLLPDFAEHPSPFVRSWAARTAAAVGDVDALRVLALDPSPNVRAAALPGLFAAEGHDLDGVLIQQLGEDDPQLLMTAARLLEGAPNQALATLSLVSAFERVTAAERETWRDVRVALLERISELGDASAAARLSPYLGDYDPVVAERVGGILERWTGRAQPVEPTPLPREPVPTTAELRALSGATLTLGMAGGGSLVIELLPEHAPTNVARIVRLAEAGYFDGLTFHRWVANFVIQGGSPNANEYQGDGPYTRDEVGGVPHWRGTVGLSTRGRDTGDGQIFVNLVDNLRLDYDYTVIGRLVEGYDVLDGILEGAVIERATVTRAR